VIIINDQQLRQDNYLKENILNFDKNDVMVPDTKLLGKRVMRQPIGEDV
jgi:hypothetical protein